MPERSWSGFKIGGKGNGVLSKSLLRGKQTSVVTVPLCDCVPPEGDCETFTN